MDKTFSVLADEADLFDTADAMQLAEQGVILVDRDEQAYFYAQSAADTLPENY